MRTLSAIPPNWATSLLQGDSVPSSSRSSSVHSTASTVSSGTNTQIVLTPRELKIVNILDIDVQITKQVAPIYLKDYYRKYSTLVSILPKVHSAAWQHPDSEWEGKPPAEREVVEMFIGKSTWHDSWQPKFSRVIQHFPEMKKWLEDNPTRQLTKQLWGREEDQPFKLKELQIWMDNDGSLDDAGLKGSKGKAKAKDTAMDTGGKSGSGEEKKKKKKAVPSTR